MKYFKNITTAEEIKKLFRAYCVNMHPDKGGDPEEFKTMMAEYNGIIKNFEKAKEEARAEEEARKEAEEERKREEEEARKAAEALRDVIAKWSGKLKTVKPAGGWIEKPSADYLAAVKYNIKQILKKYFPGVDFKVSLKNKTWSSSAEIFWIDGPTTQQVEEVAELNLFISHYHTCSPYEDYGHDEEMKSTRAWREQYGQISADRFEFTRTFSDLGKDEVMAKIYEAFPQFAGMTKKSDAAFISFDDVLHLCQLLGFHHKETGKAWADLSEEEREKRRVYDDLHKAQRKIIYDLESSKYWYNKKTSLGSVMDAFLKVYTVSEETTKAAASAAEAAAQDAAAEREQKRKEAAAILRDQIKKVSEQVASLSDTLAQMLERLNALESGQDVSEEATEEPQTGETAEDGATAQQSEETAQSRQESGSGSGVSLSMLRAAAEDAQRLTMAGEYKRAALAELYALCACGVDVLDLIDRLKAMSEDSEPAEVKTKCAEVRKFAANRAEITLSPEVLQALYSRSGTEPGSNKAA